MKKIFCPKCDTAIPLSREHLSKLIAQGEERISLVCPQCAHQLNLRLRLPQGQTKAAKQSRPDRPSVGHLVVLENVFGYKQFFPLFLGDNHIGRRNRDTQTDIPVITADPSMDRHHACIRVTEGKTGRLRYALSDDDSRVGTFVGGRILEPREWCYLEPGDVITLGATSIIFSDEPLSEDLALE